MKAQQRDDRVHLQRLFFLGLAVEQSHPLDLAVSVQRFDLPERPQLALPATVELLHLIDSGLMGPKPVAPVDEHDRFRNALEIYRPVEGRVAAAHEQHPLTLELPGVEHFEEESLLLVPVLSLDPKLTRLE